MALGQRSGSSRSCWRCSGCCAKCHSADPIPDQVVSMPATSIRLQVPRMCTSETGSPSTSACTSCVIRSFSRGLHAAIGDLLGEEVEQRRASRAGGRRGSKWPCSRMARTQPTNSSDRESSTPSMAAMTRTGICWA